MPSLFWIDLEMTGLDEQIDSILEVAIIITDLDLKPIEEYDKAVFQPPEVLEKMGDWCKKTHGASGLTEKVKTGSSLPQVEKEVLAILDRHFPPSPNSEKVVLCGNSVYNDKRFIDKYMPEVSKRLHYRMIDVSSFKEIFKRKYGVKVEKKNTHRALDDIRESIDELKTYLSSIKPPSPSS